MKRYLILTSLSMFFTWTCCLSHMMDGRLFFDANAGNIAANDAHMFSLSFSPRTILDPCEDAAYFSILNLGIGLKTVGSESSVYGKFKLLEVGWRSEIHERLQPLKPRIEEKYHMELIDWDRTGINDVDLKWIGGEYGLEYYLFADAESCKDQKDQMYFISNRSLSFRIAPNSYVRTFKPGCYAFSDLGDDCNTMVTSLFVGMDIGLRLKLGAFDADVFVKADKCLFFPVANLVPGASVVCKLPILSEPKKELIRLGLRYDFYNTFVGTKKSTAEQLSASLTVML